MNRLWPCLPLLAGLLGCDAARPSGPRALRTEVHPTSDLAVVVYDDGSLSVRRLTTGVRRMQIAAFEPETRSFGHEYEVPVCATRVTTDGHLVITYPDALRAYSLRDGRLELDLPYTTNGPQRACPNVAPDSTVLVHAARYHGSGALLRLRMDGSEVWRFALPDIGPVLGAIEIDTTTGDAILTSATHVIAVDATGRQRWAYAHAQPGGR